MDEHSPASSAGASTAPARREFLVASGRAGLLLAFAPAAWAAGEPAAQVAAGRFEPTLWYEIDGDGFVTVNITRAEMGQHVGTALARMLAEELEADWDRVRVRYVDTDPRWGEMTTGGSLSVFEGYPLLGRAGAAGRIALTEAAAGLLGLAQERCAARSGRVHAGKRSLSYGEIVRSGRATRRFSAEELASLPLKPPGERRLIGRAVGAIDIPDKTDGRARYGIDAEVEGMVYACPKIAPTRNGSRVISVDDSAARASNGYLRSLVLSDPSGTVPGWVMVLAQDYATAVRAADAVQVAWESDDTAAVSESDLLARGRALIARPEGGARVVDDAGVEDRFARAHRTLEREYTTASVLHFQLEPLNALAFLKDGRWEIHAGTQWPSLILPVLAKALGVDQEKIVIRAQLLGGGFGRRLNGDYLVPAALAAQATGRPVKMICQRADDARFDSFRSPSVQCLRMAFDASGAVLAMEHHAAAGWPNLVMTPIDTLSKTASGEIYDPDAINGADHWYSVGAQRVRALSNDLANRAFRPGWLRSVSSGWTNWALESFMDEAAVAAGSDPLAFRLKMLDGKGRNAGGAQRQAEVLRRVAARAGWRSKLPRDTGLGLATTFGQSRDMPTWVACAARVRVDRGSGKVTLEKLHLVVDAGTLVDPVGAMAQVEGGALWGVSMALHEGTQFVRGQVRDTNLDTYTPLRMRDVPALDIEFVHSDRPPVGLGEPGTTAVAPAIANAIHAAVGVRVRDLPIRAEAVLQALQRVDH